jgi:CheY-like chemotaxis protein
MLARDNEAETFNIPHLLYSVAGLIRPWLDRQNNRFDIQCDKTLGLLQGSPLLLRQCLFNLLANAGKFTRDGTITLSAQRVQANGQDWIEFKVADTGVGMSREQQEQVLRLADSPASENPGYDGSGLGLAITQRFVRQMGGRLEIKSEAWHGCAASVLLPCDNSLGATRTVVLVVDDDVTVLELMETYLSRLGYAVKLAENGEEALRMAHQFYPHVILLDVIMPGLDGWMVLSCLKNDPELAQIPVVLHSQLDERKLAYTRGSADYLLKPASRQQLAQIVSKYASAQKPAQDVAEYLLKPQAVRRASAAGNDSAATVMVVEDDRLTREMVSYIMERAGWRVSKAINGKDALEKIRLNPPDLILLDLMMPEMDGFEFVTRLREDSACHDVPVVVLSAKDLTADERELLNHTVQAVFQKGSYNREALLTEVRELLTVAYLPEVTVHHP